jgi:hypothetical protein
MTVVETVLVFAGCPLGVVAVVALLVLGPGAMRSPRYRPGGSWDYKPVWYLPHPDHDGPVSALQGNVAGRLALTGSVAEPVEASGGARGEW